MNGIKCPNCGYERQGAVTESKKVVDVGKEVTCAYSYGVGYKCQYLVEGKCFAPFNCKHRGF